MNASRGDLISTLEATHPALARLTSGLGAAELDYRSAADEWSIREILAHLVDDEMYVMRTRMELIIKEDEPYLTPHDEKPWAVTRNTSRDALEELLADFEVQRAASLGILRMLRESDWARTGVQPEYGTFTAEMWLGRWVDHDTMHLRQIEETLERYNEEG